MRRPHEISAKVRHALSRDRSVLYDTHVFCLRVIACCRAIRSFSGLLTLLCGNFIILWFLSVRFYLMFFSFYGLRSEINEFIHSFIIHEWNEPYLPLPAQQKPIFIYRPRRDGTLLAWAPQRRLNSLPMQDHHVTNIAGKRMHMEYSLFELSENS